MKAIITGATKGIGKAIAIKLAENGYDLAVCSRSTTELERFAEELKYTGMKVFTYQADCSVKDEVYAFCNAVKNEMSEVDVLVNNAGMFLQGSILDEADDQLEKQLNLNLNAAYYLSKFFGKMMRVSEQIDALEIMGINSPGYLILPKIIAGITMVPLLVIMSMFLSITGGYIGGTLSGAVTPAEYIQGITTDFNPYTIVVALVKAFVFGFIITSVPAYEGFYVKGGALEVAQASTRAVVVSCITILACDYIVTQLLL